MPLTPEQFHYAFTNHLSEEESLAVFQRYAVPGPDHVLFQAAFANFNPHAATAVDFHNNHRAPLLLISGGNDHVSPASVVEANFKLYRHSQAVTEAKITIQRMASVPRSRTVPVLRLVRVARPIAISEASQPQIKIRHSEKRFTKAPVAGSNDNRIFSGSWR